MVVEQGAEEGTHQVVVEVVEAEVPPVLGLLVVVVIPEVVGVVEIQQFKVPHKEIVSGVGERKEGLEQTVVLKVVTMPYLVVVVVVLLKEQLQPEKMEVVLSMVVVVVVVRLVTTQRTEVLEGLGVVIRQGAEVLEVLVPVATVLMERTGITVLEMAEEVVVVVLLPAETVEMVALQAVGAEEVAQALRQAVQAELAAEEKLEYGQFND